MFISTTEMLSRRQSLLELRETQAQAFDNWFRGLIEAQLQLHSVTPSNELPQEIGSEWDGYDVVSLYGEFYKESKACHKLHEELQSLGWNLDLDKLNIMIEIDHFSFSLTPIV